MKRGFSLVEVLIYSAIATALLIVMSTSLISLNRSFQVVRGDFAVNQGVTSVIESLAREIRGATSVDTVNSILGNSTGKLVLNNIDASGQNHKSSFTLQNGILNYQKDPQAEFVINGGGIQVTKFFLTPLTSPHSYAVKVDLTFTYLKNGSTTTQNFSNMYILRGSY